MWVLRPTTQGVKHCTQFGMRVAGLCSASLSMTVLALVSGHLCQQGGLLTMSVWWDVLAIQVASCLHAKVEAWYRSLYK
jgi:hypothetical protein